MSCAQTCTPPFLSPEKGQGTLCSAGSTPLLSKWAHSTRTPHLGCRHFALKHTYKVADSIRVDGARVYNNCFDGMSEFGEIFWMQMGCTSLVKDRLPAVRALLKAIPVCWYPWPIPHLLRKAS